MNFNSASKPNSAHIDAHSGIMRDGERLTPYLGISIAAVIGCNMYLDLGPTSAADLRAMADEVEHYWADWEAYQVYQENSHPEPWTPGDCDADARFAGQVPPANLNDDLPLF